MTELNLAFSINYQNFSFSIKQDLSLKGITGIFGHSGSGKSTLLRAIAGLEKQLDGVISLGNTKLVDSQQNYFLKPERRNVGLVFQNSRLFPHLTVYENLAFAAKRCKNSQLKLDEILELTELTILTDNPVTELSGGQQQRVALARAILTEPKLLLLDEPLSALDQKSKNTLLSLILKIQKQLNLPIFYVSHSLDELQQVCDNILVLSQGKVINFGNIHQVIHQLNSTENCSQQQNLIHQQTSLSLPIKTHDNGHGLAVLALHEQQEILLSNENLVLTSKTSNKVAAKPATLRCFILARDISISLVEPHNSSIVNHLVGSITAIEQTQNKVLITVNCGEQAFFVNISAYSQQKLALELKQNVHLQFKAGAVRTFIH